MISSEREEWEVALELWRYVVAATSLSPTLSSYSAVIRACSEGGFWGVEVLGISLETLVV